MDDVTGFNQKSAEYDGEKLIDAGVKKLKTRYSEPVCEMIRLMLRFYEVDRPSFIELTKVGVVYHEGPVDPANPQGLIAAAGNNKFILPKINPNIVQMIQKQSIRENQAPATASKQENLLGARL